MTLAQQLEQKGVEQSLQRALEQGRYEVAKNLLAEGLSLDLVTKVTKLSDLDLTELEKKAQRYY